MALTWRNRIRYPTLVQLSPPIRMLPITLMLYRKSDAVTTWILVPLIAFAANILCASRFSWCSVCLCFYFVLANNKQMTEQQTSLYLTNEYINIKTLPLWFQCHWLSRTVTWRSDFMLYFTFDWFVSNHHRYLHEDFLCNNLSSWWEQFSSRSRHYKGPFLWFIKWYDKPFNEFSISIKCI